MLKTLYKLLFFAIGVFTILCMSGCKSTKHDSYQIEGKIFDHEGNGLENTTVLLFAYVPLESNLVSFKSNYPNHGADLEMYDSFDHRTATPMAMVSSNASGEFAFKNVDKGTYKIVAYKNEHSFSYLKNISIHQDVIDVNIALNPIVYLPSTIGDNTYLQDGGFYAIGSDFNLLPSASLTVGENVTLLVSPNTRLNIHGGLLTDSSSSLFIMSSDKMYSHSLSVNEIGRFDSINFFNQASYAIRNLKITDCVLGMKFQQCDDFCLINLFIDSDQAISVASSPGFSIYQSTFTNGKDTMRGAVSIELSNESTVQRCHFFENKIGLRVAYSSDVHISNNYFQGNTIYDLGFDQDGAGTVEYNTFRNSVLAIDNYRGQMQANYNDIQAEIGIYAYRVNAWLSAKYNNLDCTMYGIKSQCMYYNSPIVHLDCTRNYWGTTNIDEIKNLIYDRDDESEDDVNYFVMVTKVDFLPISHSPLIAGVFN